MEKEKVILKKGKEKIVQQRHPWIFSGAIASLPSSFENGSLLPFFSSDNELLGYAYFNRKNSLSGRIISFGKSDPFLSLAQNIQEAYQLRKKLFDEKTNSYRLIHAEGDLCPGLIVDKYADYLVIQIGTLGMERLKSFIIDQLRALLPIKGIYEKSCSSSRQEEGLTNQEKILWGEIPSRVEIRENGLTFSVSLKEGQKTGFFLDQRAMRSLIASLSRGKRVLNAFSYTGGFSVFALSGGAVKVDSVDISLNAIKETEKNVRLNGFCEKSHQALLADVFSFLREQSTLDYDIIILDPPAFAKKKSDCAQALMGYREINGQAIAKMAKGSLLLTCSCSYFITDSEFRTVLFQAARKAKKNVKIIANHYQSFDHPINIYHREGEYLKGYLLYIGD